MLDDYKYPYKSRNDSSSFDDDGDDISYAEHLSYSLYGGHNNLNKKKNR